MCTVRIDAWLTAGLLLWAGCEGKERSLPTPRAEPQESAPHVHEPSHQPLPERVLLAESVLNDAHVVSQPVRRGSLVETVALPGEVAADPDKSARVASPIAGRVESVSYREGSEVRAGQPLAVIRVPDLGRLRSTLAATLGRARAARRGAERLQGLVASHLATEQSYLDALATADALDLEARAAQEQLTALGLGNSSKAPSQLTLRAPIAGTVVARNAVVGQPVSADEVLAEIVDLRDVWFLGRVFEKDLGRLALGAAAEVQLNAFPKQRFVGTVEYIGKQVDPSARTVTARVRLKNERDELRVGLFGTAYVSSNESDQARTALLVPRSALTEIGGKQVVFVRQADRHFDVHEVVVGGSAGGNVEVLAGLREGEQVVTDGVFTLKSMVLKGTLAEDE